ncbi:MAG TPA: DsbA family protein [Stellaceae bacterium]|nr:DsbA family protein [Stellaceae bacterium]
MNRPRLLLLALLAVFGIASLMPAQAADQSLPADRQALDQAIHDYLMNHPEVIVESLRAAEKKMQDKEDAEARVAIGGKRSELLNDPGSPVGGNPNGDVTIVEFFDYHCPYCKQVEPTLETLLKDDPKLRIVYKEFPILGPDSVVASHVALAALKQGAQKYARFHAALMSTKGSIGESVVMQVAKDSGLDVARLKTDMKAPEIEATIKRNYDLADALKIRGTPAFIIGDTLAPGAVDLDTLRKMVADARKGG